MSGMALFASVLVRGLAMRQSALYHFPQYEFAKIFSQADVELIYHLLHTLNDHSRPFGTFYRSLAADVQFWAQSCDQLERQMPRLMGLVMLWGFPSSMEVHPSIESNFMQRSIFESGMVRKWL